MIIVCIKSFSHFKSIENLCDGVVFNSKYTISVNPILNNEEMKEVIEYANSKNKIAIIDISSLMTNDELEDLKGFIEEFKDYDCKFLYTDIGVYNILKGYGIENNGIYDPKTLITNSYDMNLYLKNNMMAIGLSNEIPSIKIKEIDSKKEGKTWLKIFGYHQMFYSKRHLITTYHKYKGINKTIDRENTLIKEETRGEVFHIDENNHGSVIYRSYPISYMKVINDVINVDYLVLDSSFIPEDDFKYALELFNAVINGNMNYEIANLKLKEKFDIEDGFIYNDTVYIKEEAVK